MATRVLAGALMAVASAITAAARPHSHLSRSTASWGSAPDPSQPNPQAPNSSLTTRYPPSGPSRPRRRPAAAPAAAPRRSWSRRSRSPSPTSSPRCSPSSSKLEGDAWSGASDSAGPTSPTPHSGAVPSTCTPNIPARASSSSWPPAGLRSEHGVCHRGSRKRRSRRRALAPAAGLREHLRHCRPPHDSPIHSTWRR